MPYRYLLGDSRRESARLRRQARLWDPTAHALFDRLAIKPGWRALEIGPGHGSLHLELRRRVRRPVDSVERSRAFAATPLTSAKAASLRRHWRAAARRRTSLLISPTVLDVVGRKPNAMAGR